MWRRKRRDSQGQCTEDACWRVDAMMLWRVTVLHLVPTLSTLCRFISPLCSFFSTLETQAFQKMQQALKGMLSIVVLWLPKSVSLTISHQPVPPHHTVSHRCWTEGWHISGTCGQHTITQQTGRLSIYHLFSSSLSMLRNVFLGWSLIWWQAVAKVDSIIQQTGSEK